MSLLLVNDHFEDKHNEAGRLKTDLYKYLLFWSKKGHEAPFRLS